MTGPDDPTVVTPRLGGFIQEVILLDISTARYGDWCLQATSDEDGNIVTAVIWRESEKPLTGSALKRAPWIRLLARWDAQRRTIWDPPRRQS